MRPRAPPCTSPWTSTCGPPLLATGPKGDGRQLGQPNRRKIGTAMTRTGDTQDGDIPAGFTYLGQFVDHDLTFDKSRLRDDVTVPVIDLIQGRSPGLDLDSLYGLGPDMTPEFYAADKVHLLTGTTGASGPTTASPSTTTRASTCRAPRAPPRTRSSPTRATTRTWPSARPTSPSSASTTGWLTSSRPRGCRAPTSSPRPAAWWCATTSGCCAPTSCRASPTSSS